MTKARAACSITLSLGLSLGACAGADDITQLGVYNRLAQLDDDGSVPPPDSMVQDAAVLGPPAGPPSPPMPSCAPLPGCIRSTASNVVDPNLRCFELRANSGESPDDPFVPATGEQHVTFTIKNPEPDALYIRSIEPIIDNVAILHDMNLYEHGASGLVGVKVWKSPLTPASGMHFVNSWLPGLSALFLEEPVALALRGEGYLTLEAHYNLVEGITLPRPLNDRSGMRVCVTSTFVPFPVSFSRLGNRSFAGSIAQARCVPDTDRPIDLLAVLPRMNHHGSSTKLVIERTGGDNETVYEEPFEYSSAKLSTLGLTQLMPGESLDSTCYYRDSVHAGDTVDSEVCELQVLHYPANTLGNDPWDSCLQW